MRKTSLLLLTLVLSLSSQAELLQPTGTVSGTPPPTASPSSPVNPTISTPPSHTFGNNPLLNVNCLGSYLRPSYTTRDIVMDSVPAPALEKAICAPPELNAQGTVTKQYFAVKTTSGPLRIRLYTRNDGILELSPNLVIEGGPASVLAMQFDCNLVMYTDGTLAQPTFQTFSSQYASHVSSGPHCQLEMQQDGNLVLYEGWFDPNPLLPLGTDATRYALWDIKENVTLENRCHAGDFYAYATPYAINTYDRVDNIGNPITVTTCTYLVDAYLPTTGPQGRHMGRALVDIDVPGYLLGGSTVPGISSYVQCPSLSVAHRKLLAAQLAQEKFNPNGTYSSRFRDITPDEYFSSLGACTGTSIGAGGQRSPRRF